MQYFSILSGARMSARSVTQKCMQSRWCCVDGLASTGLRMLASGGKSSKAWMKRHLDDKVRRFNEGVFVSQRLTEYAQFSRQAQQQGLRSRAAFKLQQINDKFKILKKGIKASSPSNCVL